MPQMVPFYFVNQVTFVFVILLVTVYMFSKYILPNILSLFTARLAINKV